MMPTNTTALEQTDNCTFENQIEGSLPEWCTSSMIYSRDTPFWSGTLEVYNEQTVWLMESYQNDP